MNEKLKVLMIFKLTKRSGESCSYNFNSLALAREKKENDFMIIGGEFEGRRPNYFDKIIDDGNMLLRDTSNIIIANPLQNASGYACYEIPSELFAKISISGIKDKTQQLIRICALGETLELVWYGSNNPLQFKTIRNSFNNIHLKSEKDIADMLIGKKIDKTELQKKYITEIPKVDETQKDKQTKSLSIDLSNIDINEIINQTKGKIIGQNETIEAVVSNIYANQRIIETGNKDLISTQKAAILLDGPTGTGKTAIIKEVADKFSLPIVITSSTAYSSTGYSGGNLTDILVKLLDKTKGDLELAQRGIVCLDEIDKLGQSSKKEDNLVMKKAVQEELLTFIGGAKFDIEYMGKTIEFDTSNLTIIGMGAFTRIRNQKIAEKSMSAKKSKTIGFAISDDSAEKKQSDKTYVMTEQDYINSGLERELVGRFSLITSTKAYSVEDYKNILINSTISPLKMFTEFAKSFGVEDISYDDTFIEMMAEMAYSDNFGARGLQKIVSNLKNSLLLEIMNSKNKTITLTTEMLKKSEEKHIRSF